MDAATTSALEGGAIATQIFVNLPVKDLHKSVQFFTKLGYTFDPQFTDENATCMIVGENIFVMLVKGVPAAELDGRVIAERRFMYQHGYQDLDGHLWELFYMDPNAANKAG